MKFRLPPDCLGLTLAGAPLVIDEDGTIEADEAEARHLDPHDVTPTDAEAQAEPAPRAKPRSRR